MINRRVGSATGKLTSWAPPWQSWQSAAIFPAADASGMQAVRVSILRINMAINTKNLLRRRVVRQALHVLVAIDAGKASWMRGWKGFNFFASTKS